MTHAGGRPTDYGDWVLETAEHYYNVLPEDENLHSIEGLSDYLGISRSTIYDWISQEEKQEFSHIVEKILNKQGKTLINKGIIGQFTPAITKVMLTKHGYRDSIEQTGKDGKDLIPETSELKEITEKLNAIYAGTSKSGDGKLADSVDNQAQNKE